MIVELIGLTEERRKEITKTVKKMGEEDKVAIRNLRKNANDELKKEEKELTNQLEDLKHDEKLLKNEIEKLKDKDYLARYARENYAYSKEGELVLKIQKEEEEKKDNEKIQIDLTNDYFIIIGSVLFLIIIIYVIKKSKRKKS